MSYLSETDPNILNDILYRKEYQLFKKSVHYDKENKHTKENIIPRFMLDDMIKHSNYLELHSYQYFVQDYINPNTPYSRLLLNHQTGVGKTVGALSIALNFINFYQKEELTGGDEIGSVFIIGFTENIFKSELLKFPEFGFITHSELQEYNRLIHLSHEKDLNTKFNIEKLQQFSQKLKKRLTNRKGNGFFKFIGYKALVNQLFYIDDKDIILHNLTELEIKQYIASGKIGINKELLKEFKNSLIICDEIHNVYNSFEKNSWGIALQTILNYHESVRAVFLSATPINNNPTELIDLLNLLLPRKYYPLQKRSDFFNSSNNLKKESIGNLELLLQGRISFIRDVNPKHFPSKEFIGESILDVSYLKFIRCPMSKFHYNTYADVFTGVLSLDNQYLIDFTLPNPEAKTTDPYKSLGLFSTKEIKNTLNLAPIQWKSKYKVNYSGDKIVGDIFKLDNLDIVSSKYHQMTKDLHALIKSKNSGKVFIYHNVIHMSGVLLISEILNRNNIIGEFENAKEDTMCAICGELNKAHGNKQNIVEAPVDDAIMEAIEGATEATGGKNNSAVGTSDHEFSPVRYIIIHSDIEKKVISNSLEKFNSSKNVWGQKLMIIIGSKIMQEAKTLKDVQHLYIMSKPDNISTLVQIIGRCVRKNSHVLLPVNKQHVKISIYTTALPIKDKSGKYKLSYEEEKYKEKVNTYKIIQRIYKLMYENAIDSYFNYDIIAKEYNTSPSGKNKNQVKEDSIDIIHFEPKLLRDNPKLKNRDLTLDELNLSTFNAYHYKFEVEYIIYIIKRLFIEVSPAWQYADLFNAVKNPPFEIEINSKILSEKLFTIGLNNLVYSDNLNFIEPIIQQLNDTIQENVIDKLLNPISKILRLPESNDDHIITHIDKYYILMPLNKTNNEVINDMEIYYRNNIEKTSYDIDLENYLVYDMNTNYDSKKMKFINKWKNTSISNLELTLCDFGAKFHQNFIEEIITYVFNIWTNPDQTKNEFHAFYIKMLYYYDVQKLIIWAHTAKDSIQKKYAKFIIPVSVKLMKPKSISKLPLKLKPDNVEEEEVEETADEAELRKLEEKMIDKKIAASTSGVINILKDTINKSREKWFSTGMVQEFNERLDQTLELFDGIYKKDKKFKKIKADILPIGHALGNIPKLYIPDQGGWVEDPTYIESSAFIKENPIIIGYDERSKTGITVKFKIRTPIQNIQKYKDTRMIEKGSICGTKSKTYLNAIAKKLKINTEFTDNIDDLCSKIRTKLIYNELKAKTNNENIKWFYHIYDPKIGNV